MAAKTPDAQHEPAFTADGPEPAAAEAMQVIGLVASAGGPAAYETLFRAMRPHGNLAFVLVPHLDSRHEGLIAPLLARLTDMPVLAAEEGQRLRADHVYVIPPEKYLALAQGVMHLGESSAEDLPPPHASPQPPHVPPGGGHAVRGEHGYWYLRHIPPAGKRIDGMVENLVDSTHIEQAEDELRQLQETLEQQVERRTADLSREVRERKQAEEALRAERNFMDVVLNTLAALVLIIDAEGQVIRFNKACESASGYSEDELREKLSCAELVPLEERDGVQRVMEELRRGVPMVRHENHWLRRDGKLISICWNCSPLHDGAGQLKYIIGTGIDITDRQAAQEASRQHLEEAAHLQRLLTANELGSILAHELNQPLGAIAGYGEASTQLLQQESPDRERLRRNLERISEQALRAGETIRRLRAFVSKGKLASAPMDLNHSLKEAEKLMAPQAEARGIDIRLDLDQALPRVKGAKLHVEQVLLNLMRNSVDAINDAGLKSGHITLSTRREGDMACVTLRDNGPGMDDATATRVFQPFSSTKGYGLGIGLRISQSLIQAHGGRLWCEPHAPGAIFHFTLPLAK